MGTVTQIYSQINSIAQQAFGTSALTVVDNQGLIALGNTVLSSSTNTENFLNTLVQRIGKSIISYRRYYNQFNDLMMDDFDYGAIVQKIKVAMPDVEEDQSVLTDGESVDMYKVNKPKATQKLFIVDTPWQIRITIQRIWLKEAFTSAGAMSGFINAVYGEVQNKIETVFEQLGRDTIANYIAEIADSATRTIKLLTLYNAEYGTELTATQALNSDSFLRFMVEKINLYSSKMRTMSTLYNDGTATRHTPYEMQKMLVLTDIQKKLETITQYQAFHDGYVSLQGYEEVPYWQSAQTPDSINVNRASDGTAKNVAQIAAVLFDRDALGTYKHEEWTSTTPMNSAGGYYNIFWHFNKMHFNDLSENFLVFLIA